MNCIVVDDDEFSREVVRNFINKANEFNHQLNLVKECDNALDAYNVLSQGTIDIVFLDVEMPDMNGLELVQSLESLPQVILITGQNQYAVKAFEYGLTDYLVKPINYARFLKAVNKAQSNLAQPVLDTQGSDDIYVKADNKIVRITLNDIYFIEALADYVIINTENKKYIVHSTMKGLEKRLPEGDFIRVHRSYIVNTSRVDTIEDNATIIMPQKMIPIGGSYRAKFLDKLNFL